MLSLPTLLADRYEVIRRVGSGGMADVYVARDTQLGRQVALKILHSHYAKDDSFIERFRREARSAANLQHPNIVPIYDWGRENDYHFIVMEFVEGRSLRDAIAADAPIDPKRCAELGSNVLAALDYAHRNGLVHRDVKPGNIMLARGGEAKVTDFGIARASSGETITQTGAILGTAYYLSPEQAQGMAVDARSDLYSLGCVLYEMSTGRRPFEGDSPVAIAYKHVREAPVPPTKLRSQVPATLEAITLKALAKRAQDRYQSAAQMRRDLDSFAAGRAVTVTAPPPPARGDGEATSVLTAVGGRRQVRRPGWALVLVAALLVGGLLLGGWSVAALLRQTVGSTTTPDIVGRKPIDGERLLRARGLAPSFQATEPSEEVQEGRITRQRPDAKRRVAEGTVVKYWVSSGLPFVQVPDLKGKTRQEAGSLLASLGLEAGQQTDVFDAAPAGTVLGQNPRAGESVRKRTKIDLTVSKGPETAVIPNVIGRTDAEATVMLVEAGFHVQRVEGYSNQFEYGRVYDQNPKGATEAQKGSTVQILVSLGSETFAMPNVMHAQEADARQTLQEAGLVVRTEYVYTPSVSQRGTVVNQNPGAGSVVRRGQTVTIQVGSS